MIEPQIEFKDFQKIDLRVGTITSAEQFVGARKPAIKIWIDFGEVIGVKKTSAQIADGYQPESLVGQQLVAVVNFAPKQIGDFMSEVLVLGVVPNNGPVVLLKPEREVSNGDRIG